MSKTYLNPNYLLASLLPFPLFVLAALLDGNDMFITMGSARHVPIATIIGV